MRASVYRPTRLGICGTGLLAIGFGAVLHAYPSGPPAAVSGAPGERTCTQCHSGGSGGGKVEIAFPAGMTYAPGVAQQLTITVTDADAQVYGFELSARVAGDNSQAGTLNPAAGESNIWVICSDGARRGAGGCPAGAPVEYIQHNAPRRSNAFRVQWTPPATERGQVKIYIASNAANANFQPTGDDIYTASYTLTPQSGQPANQPKFTAADIVNGASFAPGISPGSFITIRGENLAPAIRSWDGAIQGTALPPQLDGVSVTVGGKPASLAYVSPGQLNVLLPTDDATGPAEVKVTTPLGSSTATAEIQRYAPGWFRNTLDVKYVVATHGDNALVGQVSQTPGVSSRPAEPGETIVLWGTGFGPTAEQVPSGQVVTKAYPLADPAALKVTIGGRDAQVAFAGVTFAGVYQINAAVPTDLVNGDHAVRAEIGGTRTQDAAFLAVQRPATAATIAVLYRLDPWLLAGTYTQGIWASPPVLGPATQNASTFTVETRAQGLDAQGQLMDTSFQWTPSDAQMVTVSPGQGNHVKITVHRAGQSSLRVTSEAVSKELFIKAANQGSVLTVEIAQQP